jgi:hypothetical protein
MIEAGGVWGTVRSLDVLDLLQRFTRFHIEQTHFVPSDPAGIVRVVKQFEQLKVGMAGLRQAWDLQLHPTATPRIRQEMPTRSENIHFALRRGITDRGR